MHNKIDNASRCREALKLVTYKDWRFHIGEDNGHVWLQIRFSGLDAETNEPYNIHGRKWLISSHATWSEVIMTAFKAALTCEEHECRETFKYRGRAIFNPHINVDELFNNCLKTDLRM